MPPCAGLCHGFAYVEGVADDGTDSAGDGSGEEFEVEGCVGSSGSDGISDGCVCSYVCVIFWVVVVGMGEAMMKGTIR